MASRGADDLVVFPVRRILDVAIHAATRDEAVAVCDRAVATGAYLLIGVVNVAKLIAIQGDTDLRGAVGDADLVLADGMGVVWAGRILGEPLPERVAGIDLFFDLVALAERRGHTVYLLGAEQSVLDECVRRLRSDHPELRISGSRNGYFDESDAEGVAEDIAASGADILFVGISSPFKEKFLARFGGTLGVSVCHGVGGSFDVVAGKVKRAPERWQRWGIEWLYRLIQEPARMWRRYLTSNSAFAWLVLQAKIRAVIRNRTAGR